MINNKIAVSITGSCTCIIERYSVVIKEDIEHSKFFIYINFNRNVIDLKSFIELFSRSLIFKHIELHVSESWKQATGARSLVYPF